jgi:hypothetical protein
VAIRCPLICFCCGLGVSATTLLKDSYVVALGGKDRASNRTGLLLYSLQLASSNIRNLTPVPSDGSGRIS